jgi:hypothetical protein
MTSPEAPDTPPLCTADDATFWPWLSWPKFEAMAGKESVVVVVPVAGLADWGLGHPLDAEETLLMNLLRDACRLVPEGQKPLVLPPLRWVFGADPSCAFAVDPPTAHALIAEVATSVAAAGFRKIAIVNASPWNEELVGAAGRDLRVGRNLHMFAVHLSALGLDLHPTRSSSRRDVQTLLTALYGREPEAAPPGDSEAAPSWGEEPVGRLTAPAVPLGEAREAGRAALARHAERLARLLSDIHGRPPLAARLTPP